MVDQERAITGKRKALLEAIIQALSTANPKAKIDDRETDGVISIKGEFDVALLGDALEARHVKSDA